MEFWHWVMGCSGKRVKSRGPIQVYNEDERCWEILRGYVVRVCDKCGRDFAEKGETKKTYKNKLDRQDFLI